jgi:hypothetical protein
MLHNERASLVKKIAGIEAAIHALNGSGSGITPTVKAAHKKRAMSAATRAKISAAAKKPWAKIKK